jgi:hypothetical protein
MDATGIELILRNVLMPMALVAILLGSLGAFLKGKISEAIGVLVLSLPLLVLLAVGPTKAMGTLLEAMGLEAPVSSEQAPEPTPSTEVVEPEPPAAQAPETAVEEGFEVDWSLLATIAGGILGAVALAGVGVGVHSYSEKVRSRRRSDRKAEAARSARAETALLRACDLRAEYAAFESDLVSVFNLPVLSDVTHPLTARFVEDMHLVETAPGPSDEDSTKRLEDLVSNAWKSWRAAKANAEKVGLGVMTPEERKKVLRAVDLLKLALSTSSEAERSAAYTRALKLVEGLVRVPERSRAQVEASTMKALPVQPSSPRTAQDRGRVQA